MSTQKNEHNPELYKPDQFTEGDNVVHTTRGWTGKVVSGSTEDRVRVDFGEHNCDFGSGKVPGLYWPTNLRRITPPTETTNMVDGVWTDGKPLGDSVADTTGSWREGETAGKAILLPFLVTVLSERHHIGSVTTGAQALIIHASDANSALGIGVKRYKDENPEAAISNTDVVPINMEAMPLVIELRAKVEALRRDGELWHLGPAKGGPNIWQDGDSLLIAVETSKGWEFALVGISADDGIASMEDYLGEFYGDYSFEDIAYWIHERDIIKLLPLRAAIDSAQRQEGR